MNVLILGRTKMQGSRRCIGGICLQDGRSVRLTKLAGNWDTTTPFRIGQIWDLEFYNSTKTFNPHTEDVIVTKASYVKDYNNLNIDLRKANLPCCPIENLFRGSIKFTNSGSGYIDDPQINFSTMLWKPDRDLILRPTGTHYDYPNQFHTRGLKYVGEPAPIPVIPARTPVRVSLARWWSPDPSVTPNRCYAQLSGWF